MKRSMVGCVFAALLVTMAGCAKKNEEVGGEVAPQEASVAATVVDTSAPRQLLWGDTHVHTSFSMDAGLFGNRLPPAAAYRFARGEAVTSSTGVKAQLATPLDFLVVADHSDNLGFFPKLLSGAPDFMADPTGKRWYEMMKAGPQQAVQAAFELVDLTSRGLFPDALRIMPGTEAYSSAWQALLRAAEDANEPGVFTALIGYEWTSLISPGSNLHRVVIYRDGADRAGQIMPYTTDAPEGSPNPRDLWRWMQRYEKDTGGQVLAIAHNGNLSNGLMFPLVESYDGGPVDERYAQQRQRWEPLYEITQIKGDGEAHPLLSPDDEFADFGTWDGGNLNGSELKTPDMLPGEYARTALGSGLRIEQRTGVNPYQFGFIGSTDSHTSLATADDNNFFGKFAAMEPSPQRLQRPLAKINKVVIESWRQVASGYAAVWATDNSREAIFDAMMRREVYATTGPRIQLRFFAGWDFSAADTHTDDIAAVGYAKGVPMGGELAPSDKGAAPAFLIGAQRDPAGARLDRVQVVKVNLDDSGDVQERIYNVDWSDRANRKINKAGDIPALASTVDVATASYSDTQGSDQLLTVWQDPDFNPVEPAAYYVRVLEIPTPRWPVYDSKRFGVALPDSIPADALVAQQRAYSSPIWYRPE